MMPKWPNAYCVGVKVYASKFEHHLSHIATDQLNGHELVGKFIGILKKYLVSKKICSYNNS